MLKPAVFGIYGNSNTGKTTLVEQLVFQFTKEGYRVATIKQTNKAISLDKINKDTWRHHDAGASLVIFSSGSETDFFIYKKFSFSEIIRKISCFGFFDLILVEGASAPNLRKIQIGEGKKRSNTIISYDNNFNEIVALVKNTLKKKQLSPYLSITVNGKAISLTDFPEQIITKTILGMLTTLKGVQKIKDVAIELKR